MYNQSKIEEQIKKLYREKEIFTASDLAVHLNLSRSMTSNYLNQLYKQGALRKENVRPARFWFEKKMSAFNKIIGYDSSLKAIIDQCKAAVNYPPDGIPVILRGSSGVGKSMLASSIYEYAIRKKEIAADAPFVTLNCADYANNPELLSSVLFGYVKGAFTGANSDKKGILDKANGGYLFLDEVHNLSQENQEKLFLLIDQKKFRRLGEEGTWHDASIRLILATTEDTDGILLATFRRRIPLEITLPDFIYRTRFERIQLVTSFFKQEAKHIDKQLLVESHFFEELVTNNYEGNVGELRNKVKISCAKSYSSQDKDSEIIYIPTIEQGTYVTITSKESMDVQFLGTAGSQNLIHDYIEDKDFEFIEQNIMTFIEQAKQQVDSMNVELMMANISQNMEQLNFFGKKITSKNIRDLAILIDLVSGYTTLTIRSLENVQNFKYLTIAKAILKSSNNEHHSLAMLNVVIAYLKVALPIEIPKNALIIMHGKNSATSLASEANQLVGDYIFEAFDMQIQVRTKEIVDKVIEYTKHIDTREGLILLVDMGSLERMYEAIKDYVLGDLLIINNVSTALALHVGFSLKQNLSMAYFTSMDYRAFNVQPQYFEGLSQSTNIVISCMSGEGIAEKIAEIFNSEQAQKDIDTVTLKYDELKELERRANPGSFKNTLCIISTSKIAIPGIDCINIEKLVNGSQSLDSLVGVFSTEQLNHFTNEIIKLFTIEGASARLQFLNPNKVINEVEKIISGLEIQYHVVFKNFIRVNLFLHLSAMIERLLTDDGDENMEVIDDELKQFIEIARGIFEPIRCKYNITIPVREYEYVYQIIAAQFEE